MAKGKKDYQWKLHPNSEASRSWKLTELEKNALCWSLCCCWSLRRTSCCCRPLAPPVQPPLAQPQVKGWGEPFPCPSLGLALPCPDLKFADVQAVSDTPKHPKEKNMLLLCFLCAIHQQMLSRFMGWQLKNIAVNNTEAQHIFECLVFPTYIAQFYMCV